VYRRNAEEVKAALLAARPGLTVVLNPEKPRRQSFEITLLDGGKGEEDETANPRIIWPFGVPKERRSFPTPFSFWNVTLLFWLLNFKIAKVGLSSSLFFNFHSLHAVYL